MANDDEYLSYEQVLQELQINRSQLNQLIREGRLGEQLVEGETKFRRAEALGVKRSLEKRPTVVEDEAGGEPTTAMLDKAGAAVGAKSPETLVLGGGELESPETIVLEGAEEAEPETDLLEEARSVGGVGERDTEILEADEPEVGRPLAEEPPPSETAMETELDLQAAGAAAAPEAAEEFFDFSDELAEADFALEAPAAEDEDEEIITDVLELGAEDEVPEEDLLSEIMDIEEEQAREFESIEETEDITAEITTLEEPTYEDSELGEVLDVAEGVEFGEELGEAAEFEVPYAVEPFMGVEGPVGKLPVVLLALTVVVMMIAVLFLVENAANPAYSTHLTGWNPFGP